MDERLRFVARLLEGEKNGAAGAEWMWRLGWRYERNGTDVVLWPIAVA